MADEFKELHSQGLKITPQRKLILEILKEFPHLNGEEIIGKAREKQPNISASTVYRNLNTMGELGLVRKVNGRDGTRRFEVNASHHHYMFCLGCNDTVEIDICPMNEALKELAKEKGFEIADHYFEIQGYCSKCIKGGLKNNAGK